jgi:hypothetical protein
MPVYNYLMIFHYLIIAVTCFFQINAFGIEKNFTNNNGTITTKIEWTFNQTKADALSAMIKFKPNQNTPICNRISFIQIARVLTSPGIDYVWKLNEGQINRNYMMTYPELDIIPGYFIDHDAIKCSKGKTCSPFYRDSFENPDESSDGRNTTKLKLEASMFDAPYGWENFEEIDLEACAVCQNNSTLNVLACTTWGGKWGLTEERSINPIQFNSSASKTFLKAFYNFNDFYSN